MPSSARFLGGRDTRTQKDFTADNSHTYGAIVAVVKIETFFWVEEQDNALSDNRHHCVMWGQPRTTQSRIFCHHRLPSVLAILYFSYPCAIDDDQNIVGDERPCI